MKKIGILNGPNLNLLGQREVDIYGSKSFEDFLKELQERFADIDIEYFQSNVEGDLINQLQTWNKTIDGAVINLAGYSHTSVALADTLTVFTKPVIEVHISNVFAREEFRHKLLTAANCKGCISGLGLEGYALAVQYLLHNHY